MGKILLAIIWGDLSFIDRLPHFKISIKVTTSQIIFFPYSWLDHWSDEDTFKMA